MFVFKMSGVQMAKCQWGSLKMLRHTERLNKEMFFCIVQVHSKGRFKKKVSRLKLHKVKLKRAS